MKKTVRVGAMLAALGLAVPARGQDVGVLQGTLVDHGKQLPQYPVTLQAPGRDAVATFTNSQGRFQFFNLPYGSYAIVIKRRNGSTSQISASVHALENDAGTIDIGGQ